MGTVNDETEHVLGHETAHVLGDDIACEIARKTSGARPVCVSLRPRLEIPRNHDGRLLAQKTRDIQRGIKDDERRLLARLSEVRPRQEIDGPTCDDIAKEVGVPLKRAHYLYEKWARKGWFDSGVSARTGWLTPDGLEVATRGQ